MEVSVVCYAQGLGGEGGAADGVRGRWGEEGLRVGLGLRSWGGGGAFC